MSDFSRQERIRIFNSLFKGRSDVFPKRWEKQDGSGSGYSPVYSDWAKKNFTPLSDAFIENHLIGGITIGVYPILTDNTSYFIAADFDDGKWKEHALRLIEECKKNNLAVYLERSRSGKGGHVWCFFENNYPSYKSRAIFFSLLRSSKNIDDFDKDDSFDRLFPNQDQLSGKGLGNLIALPLQGQPRKNGNSIFVDPISLEPFADQWNFLSNVEKNSTEKLDALFIKCTGKNDKPVQTKNGEILITLSEYVSIPKSQINSKLTTFLREELNFFNAEYAMKKNMNMPTYDLERYFKTVISEESEVLVPRGFLEELKSYLREQGIPFQISDKRNRLEEVAVHPSFELFKHQQEALKHFEKADCGILVAPPGSGKTIMGLVIIAQKKQSALILVHRKQIYDQWIERIENFLNIPKKDIGQFVSTKKSIKSPITVAMVQSLARQKDWKELKKSFGLVLVDECHHMPAKMFRDVITKFNPQYLFGLTATPKRKNNDEKLIYAYLGDIIHEVPKNYQSAVSSKPATKVEIAIRETNLSFPFTTKRIDFQTIAKVLTFDSVRNRMIAEDIATEAKSGKKCLVLTERKEHVELLNFYLKRDFETIALTSDLPIVKRKQKENQIASGHFQILIATGQLLGEGSDIRNLDTLFLVFPFSFEGKLIQYIGRIERGEEAIKKVYDYRDSHIEILDKMFKQRKRYYNKLEKGDE